MDRRVLEKCREELQRQTDELLAGAGKTVSDMTTVLDENFPDPTDRALLESNRNFSLRIRDGERKLLAKVKDAKAVLRSCPVDDRYGISADDLFQILVARPMTTM